MDSHQDQPKPLHRTINRTTKSATRHSHDSQRKFSAFSNYSLWDVKKNITLFQNRQRKYLKALASLLLSRMKEKPYTNMTEITFFESLKSSLSAPMPDTIQDLLDNEIRTLHHLKKYYMFNKWEIHLTNQVQEEMNHVFTLFKENAYENTPYKHACIMETTSLLELYQKMFLNTNKRLTWEVSV